MITCADRADGKGTLKFLVQGKLDVHVASPSPFAAPGHTKPNPLFLANARNHSTVGPCVNAMNARQSRRGRGAEGTPVSDIGMDPNGYDGDVDRRQKQLVLQQPTTATTATYRHGRLPRPPPIDTKQVHWRKSGPTTLSLSSPPPSGPVPSGIDIDGVRQRGRTPPPFMASATTSPLHVQTEPAAAIPEIENALEVAERMHDTQHDAQMRLMNVAKGRQSRRLPQRRDESRGAMGDYGDGGRHRGDPTRTSGKHNAKDHPPLQPRSRTFVSHNTNMKLGWTPPTLSHLASPAAEISWFFPSPWQTPHPPAENTAAGSGLGHPSHAHLPHPGLSAISHLNNHASTPQPPDDDPRMRIVEQRSRPSNLSAVSPRMIPMSYPGTHSSSRLVSAVANVASDSSDQKPGRRSPSKNRLLHSARGIPDLGQHSPHSTAYSHSTALNSAQVPLGRGLSALPLNSMNDSAPIQGNHNHRLSSPKTTPPPSLSQSILSAGSSRSGPRDSAKPLLLNETFSEAFPKRSLGSIADAARTDPLSPGVVADGLMTNRSVRSKQDEEKPWDTLNRTHASLLHDGDDQSGPLKQRESSAMGRVTRSSVQTHACASRVPSQGLSRRHRENSEPSETDTLPLHHEDDKNSGGEYHAGDEQLWNSYLNHTPATGTNASVPRIPSAAGNTWETNSNMRNHQQFFDPSPDSTPAMKTVKTVNDGDLADGQTLTSPPFRTTTRLTLVHSELSISGQSISSVKHHASLTRGPLATEEIHGHPNDYSQSMIGANLTAKMIDLPVNSVPVAFGGFGDTFLGKLRPSGFKIAMKRARFAFRDQRGAENAVKVRKC